MRIFYSGTHYLPEHIVGGELTNNVMLSYYYLRDAGPGSNTMKAFKKVVAQRRTNGKARRSKS